MLKKAVVLFVSVLFLFVCGCTEDGATQSSEPSKESKVVSSEVSDVSSEVSSAVSSAVSSSTAKKKTAKKVSEPIPDGPDYDPPETRQSGDLLNPLNGLKELSEEQTLMRPYAVMINNISVAQKVQTGLSKAEIIYETEVEGGITRLMAVYKDTTGVGRIGTIRSARYPYVDLALGHNAIYLHCGRDATYCLPHLSDINHIDLNTSFDSRYSTRIKNGLSKEHTLYSTGASFQKAAVKHKFETTVSDTTPWVDFAEEPTDLSGNGICKSLKFSSKNYSQFVYSESTGLYSRYSRGALLKDYFTKEAKTVTNVFVLVTDISNYPDGKHRKVALVGGTGYYVSRGKYIPIKWSKGAAKSGFKFTDTEGNPLTVNPGQSWVSIVSKKTKPTFCKNTNFS